MVAWSGTAMLSWKNSDVALEVAAPGCWETFLRWAEEVARAEGASRVRVLSYAGDALAAVAEPRGYRLWRSSYTMRVDFDSAPTLMPVPQEVEVRQYSEDDEAALRSALNDAFAEDPFFRSATHVGFREEYLGGRGFDATLWLLAWHGAELVGFILTYPEYIGDADLGYVHSLVSSPRMARPRAGGGTPARGISPAPQSRIARGCPRRRRIQ